MNVSRQAVSKWELDQSIPEMETLIGISNYFNVSMDYLLKEQIDGVENNHVKTSNEETIQQEKASKGFDFYKITMLIILAIIMTAFRFFITGDSETGLLISRFGRCNQYRCFSCESVSAEINRKKLMMEAVCWGRIANLPQQQKNKPVSSSYLKLKSALQ